MVKGQAGSLIDVSANVGIGTNTGTANADALLNHSFGLSAEELTVGNDALLEGTTACWAASMPIWWWAPAASATTPLTVPWPMAR